MSTAWHTRALATLRSIHAPNVFSLRAATSTENLVQTLPGARALTTTSSYLRSERKYLDPFNKNVRITPDRLPVNDEITDRLILLKDEAGRVTGPHRTRQVLQSMSKATHRLRMILPAIQKPPSDNPGAEENNRKEKPRPAICEMISREVLVAREAAERKKAKEARQLGLDESGKRKIKEMEMNWAIGSHDYRRKMDLVLGWLAKGRRVELVLDNKRRQKARVKPEEAQALVGKIDEEVRTVKSVGQLRRTGEMCETYRIVWEGPLPTLTSPAEDPVKIKQVELHWDMSEGGINKWMGKVVDWLINGERVEVAILWKRPGKLPEEEAARMREETWAKIQGALSRAQDLEVVEQQEHGDVLRVVWERQRKAAHPPHEAVPDGDHETGDRVENYGQ